MKNKNKIYLLSSWFLLVWLTLWMLFNIVSVDKNCTYPIGNFISWGETKFLEDTSSRLKSNKDWNNKNIEKEIIDHFNNISWEKQIPFNPCKTKENWTICWNMKCYLEWISILENQNLLKRATALSSYYFISWEKDKYNTQQCIVNMTINALNNNHFESESHINYWKQILRNYWLSETL